jgi:hypothetical protein
MYSIINARSLITFIYFNLLKVSTAVHEMLHALGAHHEQSRTDRDKYIEIMYKNIAENNYHNFKKHSTTDKHAYDGSSDLQYSLRVS